MEQNTFESKLLEAKTMCEIENRPDYWTGYVRGLRRAYHGENFGTTEEHLRFSDAIHSDDVSRAELGRGYTDGLKEGE